MTAMFKEVLEGQRLQPFGSDIIYDPFRENSRVGIIGNNRTGIPLGPKLLSRHILNIGAIGSGKTNTINHITRAVRNLMSSKDAIVFFDAKGDYLKHFYREGDLILSPKSKMANVHWNVYEEIFAAPEDEREQTIREIAGSMFASMIENSQNPIFASGARDLLFALFTVHTRSNEKWDNQKLKEFISRCTLQDLRNVIEPHEDLRWVLSYIMSDKGPTTQSYLSPLYQGVQELLSGDFGKSGDFSIRKFIRNGQGRAIFLEYDLANANVLSPIYSILLDLAMKEMLGRSECEENNNTYFMLDEFPLIPQLNYMENALNFGRSLGVRVIAGIQNASQVEITYGAAKAKSLLAGFGTVISFRLFDEDSRNVIKVRHGNNRVKLGFTATNATKGIQEQMILNSVIEDWDISNLGIGMAIVSMPMGEPFLFSPIEYKP